MFVEQFQGSVPMVDLGIPFGNAEIGKQGAELFHKTRETIAIIEGNKQFRRG
ncbi:MAG: hypothetical protein ACD_75C01937G0001 [uncultured bacterium]|nr:MAG: hypothetical protein ACD_75C01937G0001 [uncultured bacterium]